MFGTQSLNLDLSGVKEQTNNFEPIPSGQYNLICKTAEIKHTRSGNGQYIKCQMSVLDGEYEGRTIFHNFNIANDSQKAVEIGLQQLKSFLKCSTGADVGKVTDVGDLLGLTCPAVVKIRKDENYGDSNVVSYFKAREVTALKTEVAKKKKANPFA